MNITVNVGLRNESPVTTKSELLWTVQVAQVFALLVVLSHFHHL